MKKIQLNKKTYHVPTSWSEVTLKMQMQVSEDAENIMDNDVLQRLSLISGYCNIPVKELKEININKIGGLFKHLKFLNEPLPTGQTTGFDFKGEHYDVMPTLIGGQFQDFISIETAFANHKEHPYRALPYVIAVLAKRENETLDSFDIEERAKLFEELTMNVVEPLRVFFSTSETLSKINTQLYSTDNQEALVKSKLNALEDTLNKRGGTGLLWKLLRGLTRMWIRCYRADAKKFFSSTQ